jgi:hypothetical protein
MTESMRPANTAHRDLPRPRTADHPARAGEHSARIELLSASSTAPDATSAVREVAAALGDDADLYLAFVPGDLDWVDAAEALVGWAGSRVVACSSAGGIGPEGYLPHGLVAVALSGPDLTVRTVPISPLSDLETAWALASSRLSGTLESQPRDPAFAVLLADGLSRAEEELTAGLQRRLGDDIPLIGGSAGDDLRFERSGVLMDGRFVRDAATVTLVTTSAPFRPLRVQHHVADDAVLVVTDATPPERLVHTLNGRPAAAEYAAAVGTDVGRLTPEIFSTRPLMIRSGRAEWVRSISRVEPDGSLRFFCAAERGNVLRVAHATPPLGALEAAFAEVREELGSVDGVLVFDCVLRRLEFESRGIAEDVAEVLRRNRAAGFSTFGEQFGGVHVNQTMVGMAFG